MMMNVDVPAFFVYWADDYHEFAWLKEILVDSVGLTYEYEQVGYNGVYHAVFWSGDRPAQYIDELSSDLKDEEEQLYG